jgi:hypothetical protein
MTLWFLHSLQQRSLVRLFQFHKFFWLFTTAPWFGLSHHRKVKSELFSFGPSGSPIVLSLHKCLLFWPFSISRDMFVLSVTEKFHQHFIFWHFSFTHCFGLSLLPWFRPLSISPLITEKLSQNFIVFGLSVSPITCLGLASQESFFRISLFFAFQFHPFLWPFIVAIISTFKYLSSHVLRWNQYFVYKTIIKW